MIVAIAILIASTVAIAAILLLPRLMERKVVFEAAPDAPCPFGPDMAWLALKTDQPLDVVQLLGLEQPTPSNWNCGIGTVYDGTLGHGRVFVSPPHEGWVFVVGAALPLPQGSGFVDKYTGLHQGLAERFPDVQAFAAFPDIDLFAWARINGGKFVRSFAVSDAGIVISRGKPTREERALGLKLYELRGVKGRKGDAGGELLMHPTTEHVMRLAGTWSLNPTVLSGGSSKAHGYIGFAPAQWRSERLRKTA
ncbi:MAG: hypothetical protein K2Y05_11085 [Hyphomicrobiaceae bacterium]|nr:hypothetical protein [Hyphomicrobiaceae bacterium]